MTRTDLNDPKQVYHSLMLVDDDEDDQQIFISVLESIRPDLKYSVAWNGQDALEKLDNAQELPELIFLDLNMPMMNGFQFLEEVKQKPRLSEIPVVILTTTSDKQSLQRAISMGAVHCITKPDRVDLWEQELAIILKEPVNESVSAKTK